MASSPRPPNAPVSPDQVLSAEDIAFAACGKESLRGFGIRPSVLEYGKQYTKEQEIPTVYTSTGDVSANNTLVNLPAEIIEQIAGLLPKPDLSTMRATCHVLAANSQRPYIRANFMAKRFLLADSWSMQALVDISCHPVFSKTMMSVELVPWMLLETNVREFHARRKESGLPASVCAHKQWIEYERVRAEQEQQFTSITSWQSCLSKALKNFNASGAKLSIAFDEQDCAICWASQDTHCSTACGEIRLGHAVGWDYCFDKMSCRRGDVTRTACGLGRRRSLLPSPDGEESDDDGVLDE
ncbi:hypothetical protein LTR17_003596 [Elasticomyces elasticus]|nr:hypothetical protein LTR17_003596 [Elasticomyces elasticus]